MFTWKYWKPIPNEDKEIVLTLPANELDETECTVKFKNNQVNFKFGNTVLWDSFNFAEFDKIIEKYNEFKNL